MRFGKRCTSIRLAMMIFGVASAVSALSIAGLAQSAVQTTETLTHVGVSTIHSQPVGSGVFQAPELDTRDAGDDASVKGGAGSNAAVASLARSATRQHNRPIPSKEFARTHRLEAALSSAVTIADPVVKSDVVVRGQANGFVGFSGLSHVDQRTANGGNQFSLEPPDQGLCAGNGFVVEPVNDVIRVFDTRGNAVAGVEDLNTFFGLATQINRTTGVIGPFLSDPKCYFDRETQRWFVSILMQDNGSNPGATFRNFNMLAVSRTSNPTGEFVVFQYDVTDDGLNGTPSHPGCPCFGDQPLLGADRFGVYQTTNEFGDFFNGAQIYAISKRGLVAAAESSSAPLPVVVHIDASQELVPFGGLSYSIQPATSPTGNSDENDGNVKTGVEFFLSALQFVDTFDNRIAVWALTNSRSLDSASPNVNLLFDVITSETYGQPDPANQLAGEIPLGTSVGNPEEFIATNDDRMNQTVFSKGLLFAGVNSKLSVGGADQTGIAWFGVRPSLHGSSLKGHVEKQGYVALAGNNAFYPSLGLNGDGDGVIAFSISGNDFFPSAAYKVMNSGQAGRQVRIAGAGQDPDDGFTGYPAEVGGDGVARWGDYSAAVADGGNIWFASEYIPKQCSTLTLPCRTLLANWGTFVAKIRP
jgi:hypothetical protein